MGDDIKMELYEKNSNKIILIYYNSVYWSTS